MVIQSTKTGAAFAKPRVFSPHQGPQVEPESSPSSTDHLTLSKAKPWLTGALLGSATGLAFQACGAGPWSLAGAVAGVAAGAYLADRWTSLSYDTKAVLNYMGRRHQSVKLAKENESSAPPTEPLRNRLTFDPTGDVKRHYDGYDSSRDIVGLLAQEGPEDQPYRLAAELRHLRPGAEKVAMRTEWEIKTPGGQFTLEPDADNRLRLNGTPLETNQAKLTYSTRYNQAILEVGKDLLKSAGWQDGQPLEVRAQTATLDGIPFDSARAETDQKAEEAVFRWEGKTVYQILTDRFSNGDRTNDSGSKPEDPNRFHGGDWQGVIDRLDYIQGLGVDCIWLSCPYQNDRDFFGSDGYHGYWPHDFTKAEPAFGDKAKLRELVEQAHQKGMKVLLDVVVNHTGYNHPLAKDESRKDWFHHEGARNPFSQYYLEHGSLAGLPDLAHENPAVSHYLIDIHQQWLKDSGVDGYRVDAVRHVPGEFLRDFDRAVKEQKEGFLTVGEVFWNDPFYLAGYQNETQDTLFDFPLMEAMRDVFGGNPDLTLGERWRQFQEVKKHNFGQAVMDLTKQGGSSMEKLSKVLRHDHAYDNPRLLSTVLDNHDTGRFFSHAGGDKEKLEIALGFLFACRGTPSLYYGTETGMEGQMGRNREDMDFSSAPETQDLVRRLVHLRKDSQALQLGTQTELLATQETYAFTRVLPGTEVVCAFNNSEQSQTLEIPVSETQLRDGDSLKSLLETDTVYRVEDGKVTLTIPPKGFNYLEWTDR